MSTEIIYEYKTCYCKSQSGYSTHIVLNEAYDAGWEWVCQTPDSQTGIWITLKRKK
jgi:hypothetical protein